MLHTSFFLFLFPHGFVFRKIDIYQINLLGSIYRCLGLLVILERKWVYNIHWSWQWKHRRRIRHQVVMDFIQDLHFEIYDNTKLFNQKCELKKRERERERACQPSSYNSVFCKLHVTVLQFYISKVWQRTK